MFKTYDGMQAGTQARDCTREALAAVATDVFAKHGYDDATVREISKRAGVNITLIKHHFGGADLHLAYLRAAS